MKIDEQFDSIQGEGIHTGEPTSFIRLTGCNLRCKWCDTKYAFSGGKEVPVVDLNPTKRWVCITGGEPLLQQGELLLLAITLKKRAQFVAIETNGSIEPPAWAFIRRPGYTIGGITTPLIDAWDVDIKLKSSGNPSDPKIIQAWTRPAYSDQVKFKLVVSDEDDLREVVGWTKIVGDPTRLLLSPVMPSSQEWMDRIARTCVERNIRMSLQVHKVIWGNKRGV
jgi:7-carboxy-7-deazaguanine synthase